MDYRHFSGRVSIDTNSIKQIFNNLNREFTHEEKEKRKNYSNKQTNNHGESKITDNG